MSDNEDNQSFSHCSRCAFEQLEALYQLNIEAKRYAESAEAAYTAGFKADARLSSLRKKALYGLKRAILQKLVEAGCVDAVQCHTIDRKSYYCIYVGEFSFHTPISEWDEPPLDASQSPSKSLDSFDTDPDSRPDHLVKEVALKRLSEQFESPNYHLPVPFVDSGYRSAFAGWSQLPGAIEEGDRVDGQFGQETPNTYEAFLFTDGDSFQTQNGECRILDCYQAWLPPWLDRSPVMPRTVYDVELDGELHQTVRQRRIIDDWQILVESLNDPVPNVDGVQAEIAGSAYDSVEFDIGDIVELKAMSDEHEPHYCRIVEASLSYNLVMVEFEPIDPTHEVPLGLSVAEFADDVVAVYDEPPKPE